MNKTIVVSCALMYSMCGYINAMEQDKTSFDAQKKQCMQEKKERYIKACEKLALISNKFMGQCDVRPILRSMLNWQASSIIEGYLGFTMPRLKQKNAFNLWFDAAENSAAQFMQQYDNYKRQLSQIVSKKDEATHDLITEQTSSAIKTTNAGDQNDVKCTFRNQFFGKFFQTYFKQYEDTIAQLHEACNRYQADKTMEHFDRIPEHFKIVQQARKNVLELYILSQGQITASTFVASTDAHAKTLIKRLACEYKLYMNLCEIDIIKKKATVHATFEDWFVDKFNESYASAYATTIATKTGSSFIQRMNAHGITNLIVAQDQQLQKLCEKTGEPTAAFQAMLQCEEHARNVGSKTRQDFAKQALVQTAMRLVYLYKEHYPDVPQLLLSVRLIAQDTQKSGIVCGINRFFTELAPGFERTIQKFNSNAHEAAIDLGCKMFQNIADRISNMSLSNEDKKNGNFIDLMLNGGQSSACRDNEISFFKAKLQRQLFEKTIEVNAQDEYGCPLLNYAVLFEQYPVVEFMVKQNVNVNAWDAKGRIPLLLAHSNKMKHMLRQTNKDQSPISVNHQDKDGNTALITAVKQDELVVVQDLIALGACPSLKNNDGKDALTVAIEEGHHHIVDYLLKIPVAITDHDKQGRTPLIIAHQAASACRNDKHKEYNQEKIRTLLHAKVPDMDAIGSDGMTALMAAARLGNKDIVELLLHYGAHKHKEITRKRNALRFAISGRKTCEGQKQNQELIDRYEAIIKLLSDNVRPEIKNNTSEHSATEQSVVTQPVIEQQHEKKEETSAELRLLKLAEKKARRNKARKAKRAPQVAQAVVHEDPRDQKHEQQDLAHNATETIFRSDISRHECEKHAWQNYSPIKQFEAGIKANAMARSVWQQHGEPKITTLSPHNKFLIKEHKTEMLNWCITHVHDHKACTLCAEKDKEKLKKTMETLSRIQRGCAMYCAHCSAVKYVQPR